MKPTSNVPPGATRYPLKVADVVVVGTGSGGGGGGGGLTVEQVDDRVAQLLQAGTNITLAYNDTANTLTISAAGGSGGGLTTEQVDDRVAQLLQPGTNVTLAYDDTANTLTINSTSGSGGGLTTEEVDDRVAALLQAGSNITLAYNDTSNTLTISASSVPGPTGAAGPADGLYETRAAVALATIPATVKVLMTGGYAVPGDRGDALFFRVPSQPPHEGRVQSADGAWWEMAIPGEGVRIECFGGKSDWESQFFPYTDNLVAYRKAETCVTSHYLAAVGGVGGYQDKKGGPTILLGHGGKYQSMATDDYAGRGSYGFSGPIVPERTVHLKGVSSANIDEATATDCVFPAGSKGVILLPRRPDPAFPTDPTKDLAGAWGSCFENIAFRSIGFGGSMVAHGMEASVFFITKNCSFNGFGGDGYHLAADVRFSSNSNLWRIYGGSARANARHGIYCQGGDANAGYCYAVNVSDNGYWGVLDASFLGNTWVGLHADGNGVAGWSDTPPPGHFIYQADSGSYKTGQNTTSAAFVGCYHEENQQNALVNFPAVIVGGNLGEGHNSGTGHQLYGTTVNRGQLKDLPGQTCRWGLGYSGGESADMLFSAQTNAGGEVFPYQFVHDWRKNLSFQYTDLKHIFDITTMQTNVTCGRSAAVPYANIIFPAGVFIGSGDGSDPNSGRQVTYAAAPPTSGAHAQGDRVYNNAPTAGGSEGWVCVTTGTPGTWKTFGAISP